MLNDLEYALISRKILKLLGIDLSLYKSQQMRRRLHSLANSQADSISAYCALVESDEAALSKLKNFLTINAARIEDLAVKHELVEKAAAFGVADRRLGEKVCLAVIGAAAPGSALLPHPAARSADSSDRAKDSACSSRSKRASVVSCSCWRWESQRSSASSPSMRSIGWPRASTRATGRWY